MIHATPRLRFAPSPTGPLHLGGARTALYNWAAARALGGRFVLRIEDTDQARSTAASLQVILQGLRWLGIDWDEGPEVGGDYGPYFQMQRLASYREAAAELLDAGRAYWCFCSPERVAAVREQQKAAKSAFLGYDGHCRELTAAQRKASVARGIEPSVRFRMPDDRVVEVHDLIRGDVQVNTKELDDWVMLRPDGVPLYNFACVVDDVGMQITHVVRGEEHFLNGVKQHLLFEALGHECPQFAHIPLILNAQGKKLSKRDADTNMLDYRDKGFPAEAVFNYIALLGWGFAADRDLFTRQEMVERFRIENVGKSGARFDEEKLRWMCGEYVRRMSPAECLERARPWLADVVPDAAWQQPDFLQNVIACYQERVQLLADFRDRIGWCFGAAVELDEAGDKNLRKHDGAAGWLRAYADALDASTAPPSLPQDRGAADRAVRLPSTKTAPESGCAFATPAQLEAQCRALADDLGVKFGHLVQPVRAALTGTDKGPGLFDAVFLLGKTTAALRLRAAAARLG